MIVDLINKRIKVLYGMISISFLGTAERIEDPQAVFKYLPVEALVILYKPIFLFCSLYEDNDYTHLCDRGFFYILSGFFSLKPDFLNVFDVFRFVVG